MRICNYIICYDLLLTYFVNEFTLVNTHIKKMCGWTFNLY